ncbi:glycoside hydrolase family 172 protein [Gimesia aquarii]|nr:glycoside hydrolase family 172 protein [Gimesia aquarii]
MKLRATLWLLLLISTPAVCPGAGASPPIRQTSTSWQLDLPDHPVSRRISLRSEFKGKQTFGTLIGPGCIRRIWVTGNFISRKDILRIYFDGETIPSVEAPLPDFFGLMHNLTQPGKNYQINSPFLSVKPKLGMTCYLPMPFAKGARIEVESPEGSIVYMMVDWHDYPGQQLKEKMRFRARWRRESPVADFADDFIMLDAAGPGRLIGFVYAVDMLESRHKMRWSHGGADNIYIDGLGDQPSFLRGIGGEDTFGASHGGADYVPQTFLYSDMPYYIQKDAKGERQKLVGYRFFAKDEVHFNESLHIRFGARAHDISSTAYWYSEEPVRPYFKMPPVKQRLPQTKILRGEYDLPLPDSGSWWLAGPFAKVESLPMRDGKFNPKKSFLDRAWKKRDSIRGFVEFNHVLRPKASNANSPTLDGWAVAYCKLEAQSEMTAEFRLAWDDHLILKLNDDPTVDLGSQPYIRTRTLKVKLLKGTNKLQVWLSNQVGVTRGAWNFAFRATAPNSRIILPRSE